MSRRTSRTRVLTAAAAAAVVAGLAYAPLAGADTATSKLASGIKTTSTTGLTVAAQNSSARPRVLGGNPSGGEPGSSNGLPEGVPTHGSYAFLLKLGVQPTLATFNAASTASAGRQDAKAQFAHVQTAQSKVVAALPAHTSVLYKTHAVLAGVAVVTDVANYAALQKIAGVTAVYPIVPKSPSNSYAVPLQRAPETWTAYGDLGANSSVGIIDTGIDYTHKNFGGIGTVEAFKHDQAALGKPVDDPQDFPSAKVVGGYDLAGDAYQADPNSPNYDPNPAPDPYPLDCNGHGSHVAGTVGGYGERANGNTYTGAYNTNTPFSSLRIGPGMAPEAKLYAFRVFGCEGSTDLVGAAIDRAADPNGDGDPSDRVDVVNMSLGSDFGSPQDGDSVATDAASALGITMVVASGNAGDLYDAGGSPGDAPRALAVAASTDNYAQVDALTVSAPPAIAGSYAAERSIAYDYATKPDLSGTVARVTDPTNLDGCDTLSPADAAAVKGKIAFVEWTDLGTRRCGSVQRGIDLAAAGATGFIFADDTDAFTAGITGSDKIPGVLLAKTGGDAIRSQLTAGHTVTISGTVANGFRQILTGHNDQVASFSSRGIGDADNVKPDVSAVGESVFSTASGTGDQGTNDSGTSMATPMTAGLAALVTSQHADWSPEQVKADIMNTAEQDLFVGPNHTGTRFAPQRVGSGRIDAKAALDNNVLAYNAEDTGSVSVSFGPQAVTSPTTLTKTIRVQNTTLDAATYAVSFVNRTTIPGATYSVSPSSVTVAGRSSSTVTVKLTLDPAALTKTIDPTMDRETSGIPRVYQADASGLVRMTASGQPTLSVPVYAAPRPASSMTQPSSLTLPSGAQQSGLLTLSGQSVDNGAGANRVESLVAGFELAATSPPTTVDFPDEGTADIREVGVTSDAQQIGLQGGDPTKDATTYFAIAVNHPWRTPAGIQEYDVLIDKDNDGKPDLVVYDTRLAGTDILVAETVDLSTGKIVDDEPLNAALGDTDTALLESSVLVLPVTDTALGISSANSRFSYGVDGFSGYATDPIDEVGFGANDAPALSFDPLHPGAAVYGSVAPGDNTLLFADAPGTVLKVTRDAAAYAADKAQGLMMVHFQNTNDTKVQTVALSGQSSTTTLAFNPTTIASGGSSTATVTVSGAAGTPTGTVTLSEGSTTIGTGTLTSSGTATITVTPSTTGTHTYTASYSGNSTYSGSTASASLTVTSAQVAPTVTLTAKKHTVKLHHKIKTEVTVTGTAGTATGTVEIGKIKSNGGFKVLATGTLSNGSVKIVFKANKKGTYHLQARYSGNTAYTVASSGIVKVKVKKQHQSHR